MITALLILMSAFVVLVILVEIFRKAEFGIDCPFCGNLLRDGRVSEDTLYCDKCHSLFSKGERAEMRRLRTEDEGESE